MQLWASTQVDSQWGTGEHDTTAETWDSDTGRTHLVGVKPSLIQHSANRHCADWWRARRRYGFNSSNKAGMSDLCKLRLQKHNSQTREILIMDLVYHAYSLHSIESLSWWTYKWTSVRLTLQQSGPHSPDHRRLYTGYTYIQHNRKQTKQTRWLISSDLRKDPYSVWPLPCQWKQEVLFNPRKTTQKK